ncbi:hypothetical protein [Acaryochloris marina]|uniref:Uncharacterized protein n=1 Tax=Acaryochloris marina (strain MBIC 11017) TaxID=329726 RepID=B0CAB1_ACAM1|nr:hypothetical protein [Acaryochloris marina]ABW27846.1 conserved hypothetical protein [Acaryochloris marina MBIC11017]BDM82572.1 hypothetical protein AM10699_54330 [Acaryochloris marina MBIC10699]
MKRTTRTALSLLTSLTLHSIGFTSPTLAETTLTRGPNFAAHPVNIDNSPVPANAQGSSGATQSLNDTAPITQTESGRDTTTQSSEPPKIITRGPNGAAHILN